MTHSLDFTSVSEKLFLIQQLVAASRDYCKTGEVGRRIDRYGEGAWSDYSSRLRQLVSSYSIECAVKARMLQDTLAGTEDLNFSELDATAREGSDLGKVHVGSFELTVRESCNKIIHATNVELGWAETRFRNPHRRIEYWDGTCHLRGKLGKSPWHVELNMTERADSLDYFIDLVASSVSMEDFPLE